jgi:DNA ligase (NAD+)
MLDNKSTFHTARWSMAEGPTIESLGELLTKRKETSAYEIDGIIVAHDSVYPRIVGNPEHAFAFKMSFADQQTTTEVLNVLWEVSKDGYLKPTVNFEPVNIGGVVIQYATGFNAAFIHENGIGPGAFIDIIRSGDVIPYIKAVQAPAPGGPQMPTVAWHWNETHVDAVLDDIGANPDEQKRILLYFAQTLEIGFCGEGNITKIYDSGIHTIDQFITMTVEDLRKEFAAKSAAKVISERDAAFAKATLVHWAVGTGIFGRGIGTKRVAAALEITPPGLTGGDELVAAVAGLAGWSRESAAGYVANLPAFKAFMEKHGIRAKVATPVAVVKDGKLVGQVVLFTGWHPKDLETAVAKEGGVVADAFTGKVTVLVVKDASVSNEKTKKAAKTGIPVLTGDAFKAKYAL